MRVSGVRKSCATLSLTCLTSPIRVSMRSSIRLRFSATRSHSSWLSRSGMRWSRPLCMMARLVALIDSIRPTVRRVTRMLTTPASTKINAAPEITAVLIRSVKLSRSPISRPTSKTVAARQGFEHGAQQRWVRARRAAARAGETRSIRRRRPPTAMIRGFRPERPARDRRADTRGRRNSYRRRAVEPGAISPSRPDRW